MPLYARLPEGPLDLLGDIHGELDALHRVLRRLGVDPDACTSERPLVFVGDLVDRGPDSVGVYRLVRRLCEAGIAQMVLGNHELNLITRDAKEGNGWALGHDDGAFFDTARRPFDSRPAESDEVDAMTDWFEQQPIVAERDDLRVVHAYWSPTVAEAVREDIAPGALWQRFEDGIAQELAARGIDAAAAAERAAWSDLHDLNDRPDVPLPHVTEKGLIEQRGNPLRTAVCGVEHAVPPNDYEFQGGKWRALLRTPWWRAYEDAPAVVVGHYWRRRGAPDPGKPDLWDDVPPFGWAGPRGNVFCVDYSVGRRYRERWLGRTLESGFHGALAAMRWPERTLVFDDGDGAVATTGFGG